MGIPVNEQETVINFWRDSNIASVYTSDSTMITKLMKRVKSNPDEWIIKEEHKARGEVVAYTYECPKKYISFRTKSKVMSDEQKQNLASRLSDARKQK